MNGTASKPQQNSRPFCDNVCASYLSSSVFLELDEVVLVDDRLELDVLSGVGLVVEDGLRGVGVDLGGALVLGASPDHA